MALIYKIRNKTTGLFSSGGPRPQWTRLGKVWPSLGVVQRHMYDAGQHYTLKERRPDFYGDDCEVVEYEQVERKVLPAVDLNAQYHAVVAKRDAKRATE